MSVVNQVDLRRISKIFLRFPERKSFCGTNGVSKSKDSLDKNLSLGK
jgi:hypothetical protein